MKSSAPHCQAPKLLRSSSIFILDVFTNTPAGKIDLRLAFSTPGCVLTKLS
ncbi:MAG: hypothetical protein WD342_12440 [Verrucomicrobiales bacterium]